jgi:hypothetical protein
MGVPVASSEEILESLKKRTEATEAEDNKREYKGERVKGKPEM